MTIRKMSRQFAAALAVALSFGLAAPVWAANEGAKQAKEALNKFKKADPELAKTLTEAAGYAVLPNVSKGAAVVGAGGGEGILYEKGIPTGTVKMNQLSVGAQLGAQSYSELIVFATEEALETFKRGELSFSANTSAVAVRRGSSSDTPWLDGVKVFTLAKSGLMFEASVGGQRFRYTPYDEADKVSLR